MSKGDGSSGNGKSGVPNTITSIPLVDPHTLPAEPSIGDLVKDATTQMSTLVRAEVELARAEVTRDVKKGLTGSLYFIAALVVLFYSTFFFFYFIAELLNIWLPHWSSFLIVFAIMMVATGLLAWLGYRKVRRIRGPRETIESVKETREAFASRDRGSAEVAPAAGRPAKGTGSSGGTQTDPSGW